MNMMKPILYIMCLAALSNLEQKLFASSSDLSSFSPGLIGKSYIKLIISQSTCGSKGIGYRIKTFNVDNGQETLTKSGYCTKWLSGPLAGIIEGKETTKKNNAKITTSLTNKNALLMFDACAYSLSDSRTGYPHSAVSTDDLYD